MEFVRIERTESGYYLDPRPYLSRLREIRDRLPTGALSFAEELCHYDFSSTKCVKDLKLSTISLEDVADKVSVEIVFSPSKSKHDVGLRIQYKDVTEVSVKVLSVARESNVWPDSRRLGDFQLDEILPTENGCSHEILLTGGTIRIVAADLLAEWSEIAGNA